MRVKAVMLADGRHHDLGVAEEHLRCQVNVVELALVRALLHHIEPVTSSSAKASSRENFHGDHDPRG